MTARLKDSRGFTLLELMIVVAIIAVVAHIAILNFIDLSRQGRDTAAKSDARNLVDIVMNNFLDNVEVDYTHNPGDGSDLGSPVIYTLSPGVKARVIGHTDFEGSGYGYIEGWIYHAIGSDDPGGEEGRLTFYFYVDEEVSAELGGDDETAFTYAL